MRRVESKAFSGTVIEAVHAETIQLPALRNLPRLVKHIKLGDAQEMQNLFASFGVAMAVGVLCIYGVLVLLFKDFMQPVTILTALLCPSAAPLLAC